MERSRIKSFVKDAKVGGDKAVIEYTLPILPQNIIDERAGVLPTVYYGGRYCTVDRTRTFELDFIIS